MVILVGVLGGLFVLAAAFALLDPFNLNLFGRLSGDYDAVAAALPADVDAYMGVNLLNVNRERLTELQTTFQNAADGTGAGTDMDDVTNEMEDVWQELEDDFGMTLEEDVLPWIGQYAGIGLSDVRFNEWGEVEEVDWLVAIETRNQQATDDFITKFLAALEENNDMTFDSNAYQDVTIYEAESDYDKIAVARSGNVFYLAPDARTIRTAVDAGQKNSLAQQEIYQTAVAQLPSDRGITLFWTAELADAWVAEQGGDRRTVSSQGITAVTLAASLVDEGVRFDAVTTYDPDKITEATAALLADDMPFKIDESLPVGTLGYMAGNRLDLVWQTGREAFTDAIGQTEFDDMMAEFEDIFGFDPEFDLAPHLTGEWVVGVIPSANSVFAEEVGVNLGTVALVGITDAVALQTVAADVSDALEDEGGEVDTLTYNGQPAYEVYPYEDADYPVFTYHVGDEFLTITSTYDELAALAVGDRLTQSAPYKQLWRAFPRGMKPVLYADVTALVTTLLDDLTGYELEDFEEVAPFLEPITAVAAASQSTTTMSHQTLLVFIETNPQ